jgi:hypothetical protein
MITDTCELLASNLNTGGVSPLPYLIYTLLPNIDPTIYTASLLQKWNKTECNRENKKGRGDFFWEAMRHPSCGVPRKRKNSSKK